jgi:transcriptional regulator with XRE-family HTH domain
MASKHVLTVRGGQMPPDSPAVTLRKKWGGNIRNYRELRGLNRRQFAEALEVTEQAVYYWECGKTAPKPANQAAIAKVLGVPWFVLFEVDPA